MPTEAFDIAIQVVANDENEVGLFFGPNGGRHKERKKAEEG
jgi:hypothetical protein